MILKIRIFAKKHAKVRKISEIPLPRYTYLTHFINPDAFYT